MATVRRTEFMRHSPEQMFALVSDIESYPQFVPWCRDARVDSRVADRVDARLSFKKGGIGFDFATRNTMRAPDSIALALLEGPFKTLEGEWLFEPVGDGCKVSLWLSFDVQARLLGAAVSAAFRTISASMVDAFRERADELYGG